MTKEETQNTALQPWPGIMVESLDYAEAPRSRDGRAMPPVEPAFDQAALTGGEVADPGRAPH